MDTPIPITPQEHTSRIIISGPLALFAARLLSLQPGEYMIALDTTIPRRPRWKVSSAGQWEKPKRAEPG